MSKIPVRAVMAAIAVGVASVGAALATPVPTLQGDPYPAGSELVFSGGPYTLPGVGTFDSVTASNFNLVSIGSPGGPNEVFNYTGTATVPFTNPLSTGIFSGTLQATVIGRTSVLQTGTFTVIITAGSFAPAIVNGQTVVYGAGSPLSTTERTATYSSGGPTGLFVSTQATDSPIGFTVNGGPFISTPLSGTSQLATPLPATLPLFGAGLGLVGWLARRRKGAAAPVAA